MKLPGFVGVFLGTDHVHDGVDEREMCERLREVAEVAAGARVDLLGIEMQRTGERQQALAQVLGPAQLTLSLQLVPRPLLSVPRTRRVRTTDTESLFQSLQ